MLGSVQNQRSSFCNEPFCTRWFSAKISLPVAVEVDGSKGDWNFGWEDGFKEIQRIAFDRIQPIFEQVVESQQLFNGYVRGKEIYNREDESTEGPINGKVRNSNWDLKKLFDESDKLQGCYLEKSEYTSVNKDYRTV